MGEGEGEGEREPADRVALEEAEGKGYIYIYTYRVALEEARQQLLRGPRDPAGRELYGPGEEVAVRQLPSGEVV